MNSTQIIGSADISFFIERSTNKENILEALIEFQESQEYPI